MNEIDTVELLTVEVVANYKNAVARKRPAKKYRPKIKVPTARRLSPSKKVNVTRQEYNEMSDILNRQREIIEGLRRELETQFKRMAQMQSELDEVRRAWQRAKD